MKTAIIGYGRSGKSAEGILKARGDEVAIVDDKQLVVVSPGVRVMSELEFGVRELKARRCRVRAASTAVPCGKMRTGNEMGAL